MERKRASFKDHSKIQKLKLTEYETTLTQKLKSVNEPTLKPDDYDNLVHAFHKNDPDENYQVPFHRIANLMQDASRSSIPAYELRQIAESKGINSNSELTPESFVILYIEDQKREAMNNPGFTKGLSRVCSRKHTVRTLGKKASENSKIR